MEKTNMKKISIEKLVPTIMFKINGSISEESVKKGTEVLFEVTNAYPEWGVHFVSITDGYKIIEPMVVADVNGYAYSTYTASKSIEIYAYSDYDSVNSNSVKIAIPSELSMNTIAIVGGVVVASLYYLTKKK